MATLGTLLSLATTLLNMQQMRPPAWLPTPQRLWQYGLAAVATVMLLQSLTLGIMAAAFLIWPWVSPADLFIGTGVLWLVAALVVLLVAWGLPAKETSTNASHSETLKQSFLKGWENK